VQIAQRLRSHSSGRSAGSRPLRPGSTRWNLLRLTATRWGWVHVSLAVVVLVAAVSYSWAIQRTPLFGFYAGAVRSTSQSWTAFFFGGFDPGGRLTLDKLPGAFWVQALAARVFGYSTWTIIGPQVVEGLLTIIVTFRLVRRFSTPLAALVSSAVVAAMPVFTAASRGNVSDPLSTLLILLAADATLRAVVKGQFRSLLCAALWVGAAFQAKMLQAWLLLPVIALVYLLTARPRLATRIVHTVAALVTAVAVSTLWMVAVTLVPASDRPWFDGSTHNSIFEQVFVYNGFGRFVDGTSPDPGRIFYGSYALGVSWLIPLALLAGIGLLTVRRWAPRTDAVRAATVLCLAWLVVHIMVFSAISRLNDYYTEVLVPPTAALVGASFAWAWETRKRASTARWSSLAVSGSAAYATLLLTAATPRGPSSGSSP
jgi:4-amino-4-deoxy-L-arabinose transferase-like glycosyltransferase